jgi:hypothetical protein
MSRRLCLLIVLIMVALGAGARGVPGGAEAQTPGAARPVRLPGHVAPAVSRATQVASAPNAGSQPLHLTVVLNRTDPAGFAAFVKAVQDPTSPSFQHFLSQDEQTQRFGPSQQAYDAVLKYMQQQGFTLVEGSANRLTLSFNGTRAQAEQAFAVRINDYQLGSRQFYASPTDPAVPAAVAPDIQAIIGLSNLVKPEPQIAHASPEAAPQAAPAQNPMAFATAYNFAGVHAASGAGSGETVGLLEFDNYFPADVTSWLSFVGLPTSLANQVSQRAVDGGTTPGGANSGEGEVLLDISTVLGMAQGATIKVYDAPGTASFEDEFNAMIGDKVDVISSSWEGCEFQTAATEASSMDTILAGGVGSGISIFQSSGDHGANCNEQGTTNPAWPGDDPAATAVGGTNLQVTASGAYQGESWWDGGSDAAGQGGFGTSCCLTSSSGPEGWGLPTYQTGFTTATFRSTPDVSADADPATGIALCEADAGGCSCCTGGTSMAAPEWAAGLAVINQGLGERVGNLDPLIYAQGKGTGFHPASGMSGSTTGATNDFAHLGLGSFNLGNLFTALGGKTTVTVSAANSTVSASPTNLPVSGNTTLTITFKDATGNGVSGQSAAFSFSNAQASVVSTSGASNASGIETVQITDTAAGPVTITVFDSTQSELQLSQTAVVTFTGSVSAGNSSLGASPTSAPADGSSQIMLTATLKDTFGNPVSGKAVTILPGPNTHSSVSPASVVTNSSGQAVFHATDSTAETISYDAEDITDSNLIVSLPATVQFTALSVSGSNSSACVTPPNSTTCGSSASAPADGSSTATVTVTLKNTANAAVSGKSVSLTGNSGTHSTVTTLSGTTNSSGQATFSVKDGTAETVTYTAADSSDGVTVATTVSVSFTQTTQTVSGTSSTVTPASQTVNADGTSVGAISVTLLDTSAQHLPVAGKAVSLSGNSGTHSTVTTVVGTTNGQGQATFSVKDSTAETVTYTATDTTDGITVSTPASVTFQPVNNGGVGVSIQPASATVGVGGSVTLALQATAPAAGLGSWTVDVQYDPTVLSIVAAGCSSTVGSLCNTAFASNKVRVAGNSVSGLTGSQALASLTFTAVGATGSATAITPLIVTFIDAATNTIPNPSATGGTVTVGLQGDVNLDGQVTSLDGLCVLRIVAALPGTTGCPEAAANIAAADVNRDGQVTSLDGLCVLRIVAALPTTSGCPIFALAQAPAVAVAQAAQPAASDAATQLSLSSPSLRLGKGQQASVRVTASAAGAGLGAWTVDVGYDPTAVRVVSCQAADGSVCNASYASGVVRVAGSSTAGLSGNQTLATLTFAGVGHAAGGQLSLTPVTLTDPSGARLTDGSGSRGAGTPASLPAGPEATLLAQ